MNFINLILSKVIAFVNRYFNNIMLFFIVALLVLLSFTIGFIMAKYQLKTPIQIEQVQ